MARPRQFDEVTVLNGIMLTFWKQGYYQTSLDDLISTSGLKKQSLYNAYGNKHQLFIKALENYFTINTIAITKRVDHMLGDGSNTMAVLRDLFIVDTNHLPDDPDIKGCLMINSMVEFKHADSEIRKQIDKLLTFFDKTLMHIVVLGQQRNEITSRLTPEQIVAVFMNAYNGFQVCKDYDARPEQLNTVTDSLLQLIKN